MSHLNDLKDRMQKEGGKISEIQSNILRRAVNSSFELQSKSTISFIHSTQGKKSNQ